MVRPWVLALTALVATPLLGSAQETDPVAADPHTVVRGNTLWDLAAAYCRNPFEWPTLFDANREVVEDPHWIYPGERLQIACAGGVVGMVEVVSTEGGETVLKDLGRVPGRTLFYQGSGSTRSGGMSVSNNAPVLLMAVTEDQFYSAEWLVDAIGSDGSIGRLEELAPFDEARGETQAALVHNRVRIRMSDENRPPVGSELVAFRIHRVIEGLGRVALPTGRLTVTSVEDAGVVAVVEREYERMAMGDRVVLAPDFDLVAGAEPSPISGGVEASIIAFADDRRLYNSGNVAFLDVGSAQGVEIGDEFDVYAGDHDGWSAESIGRVQVLRVDGQWSAARITDLNTPIFEPGLAVRLTRKMP